MDKVLVSHENDNISSYLNPFLYQSHHVIYYFVSTGVVVRCEIMPSWGVCSLNFMYVALAILSRVWIYEGQLFSSHH